MCSMKNSKTIDKQIIMLFCILLIFTMKLFVNTALATLYVRYKQVQGYLEQIETTKYRVVDIWNKIGLFFAVLVCLGLSLVANFQVCLL